MKFVNVFLAFGLTWVMGGCQKTAVPLLSVQEKTIRNFGEAISTKQIDKVVAMISRDNIATDEDRQEWKKQFEQFTKFKILSVKPEKDNLFRVEIEVGIINEGFWTEGVNVRWIELTKDNDDWKITKIATGP